MLLLLLLPLLLLLLLLLLLFSMASSSSLPNMPTSATRFSAAARSISPITPRWMPSARRIAAACDGAYRCSSRLNATQHLDAVLQWDRVEGIREARVVVAAAEKIAPLDLLRPSRLGKGFAQGTHEFALIRELLDKAVVSVGRVWRAGGDKQSV